MVKVKAKPGGKPAKAKAKAKPKAAAVPKVVDYRSPEMIAKYDAETQRGTGERLHETRRKRSEYLVSKETTAELKKSWEVSQADLNEYIEERNKYRGHPPKGEQKTLLDLPPVKQPKEPAAPSGGQYAIAGGTKDDTNALPASDGKAKWFPEDLYKKFPVDQWKGLTAKDLEALRSGKAKRGDSFRPIETVGDLQAFVQPNPNAPDYTRNYGDIVGIGATGATRISDAEMDFWKRWNGGEDVAFAMKQGYKPAGTTEGKADADSQATTAGSAANDPGTGDGEPGGKPGKPGKRKPGAGKPKLRGGTNGKPVKFKKPKPSGTAEERAARDDAEAGAGSAEQVQE